MAVNYGSLPFAEQIAFFRRKLNLPTATWRDIWQPQHDTTFVVAGANRDAIVEDFRAAIDKAVSQGTTLAEFRKDFDRIVATYGWSYNGGRGWRSRVIYDTNLRTSYAAGRLTQMKAISDRRPYWRYRHSIGVADPRPQHLAWNGRILRHDDPWWDVHYPPNAWGCRCYVETLAERDMKRLGKAGPDTAPTAPTDTTGIGEGWAYTPGRSRLEALAPQPLDELLPSITPPILPGADMPAPRETDAGRVLPEGLADQEYIDAFLAEFGLDVAAGERTTFFEDVLGEYLVISDALFRERRGKVKVAKRGRAPYVRLMADTIREPDEIWVDWAEFKGRRHLRRRYVARWLIEGEDVPVFTVFDQGAGGWEGVTAVRADDVDYLEHQVRLGRRVYVREEE